MTIRLSRCGTANAGTTAGDLLRLDLLPTAVTTFNDHCALGLIDRLTGGGIAVPEMVSVAGYDNAPIAQFAAINLTTVSQEAQAQAEWAVRAALERLDGAREDARESILQPRLVVRGSTGSARSTGQD